MNLLVLAGDGIGPEITAATLSVLRAASGSQISKLSPVPTNSAMPPMPPLRRIIVGSVSRPFESTTASSAKPKARRAR